MTTDNWLGVAGLALFAGFGIHVVAVLSWPDRVGLLLGVLLIAASLILRNNPSLFKPAAPKP